MRLATNFSRRFGEVPVRRLRARAGVIVLSVLAVWGAIDFYQLADVERRLDPDSYRVGEQEARFRAVAGRVPPGEVLGYVSNVALDAAQGQAMFFGARYALAPRLVTDSPASRARLVLGNFSGAVDLPAFCSRFGLRVTAELGDGVVLFEREAK